MQQAILGLLVVVFLYHPAIGFQCYSCVYMNGEGEDAQADAWIADAIYELGGKEKLCKDTFSDEGKESTQYTCGDLPVGADFWGCAKTDISAKLNYQGSSVSVTAVKRNCIPLWHNHTYSAEKCHQASDADNPFSGHAVHSVFLGSKEVKQNGHICICHTALCNAGQRTAMMVGLWWDGQNRIQGPLGAIGITLFVLLLYGG